MRLWKFLNEDGSPCYGGSGRWSLPKDGKPGDWMPAIAGELIACQRGYHACRDQDLTWWLGPVLYRLEARGDIVEAEGNVVCREARLLSRVETWNGRTARLFACDCAERVLPIYEALYPDDDHPRRAIEVVRRYARGEATMAELDAAGDAADAAWSTANVAWTAPVFADVASIAADVAWSARVAVVPTWAAADAARVGANAARAAERQWQTERLLWYLDGCPEEVAA